MDDCTKNDAVRGGGGVVKILNNFNSLQEFRKGKKVRPVPPFGGDFNKGQEFRKGNIVCICSFIALFLWVCLYQFFKLTITLSDGQRKNLNLWTDLAKTPDFLDKSLILAWENS